MYWWLFLAAWAFCLASIVRSTPVNHRRAPVLDNSTSTAGSVSAAKPFVWASLGDSWAVSITASDFAITDKL
jgi:hypothetical protein